MRSQQSGSCCSNTARGRDLAQTAEHTPLLDDLVTETCSAFEVAGPPASQVLKSLFAALLLAWSCGGVLATARLYVRQVAQAEPDQNLVVSSKPYVLGQHRLHHQCMQKTQKTPFLLQGDVPSMCLSVQAF